MAILDAVNAELSQAGSGVVGGLVSQAEHAGFNAGINAIGNVARGGIAKELGNFLFGNPWPMPSPLFGVLGQIEFQVLESPIQMKAERHYNYAQHDVVEGTPRLQWTGDGLQRIELTIRFHQMFSNVSAQLTALRTVAKSHVPQPLVFSNGHYRGNFVIEEVSHEYEWLDGTGNYISVQARICLKENNIDPAAAIPLSLLAALATTQSPLDAVVEFAVRRATSFAVGRALSTSVGRSVFSSTPAPLVATGSLSDVSDPANSAFIDARTAVRSAIAQ